MSGRSSLLLLFAGLDTARKELGLPAGSLRLAAMLCCTITMACGTSRGAVTAVPVSGRPVVVTGVTVIDVRADSPAAALLADRTVIVEHGRITVTGPSGVPVPRESARVDGRGRYLIPGLWDSHSHVSLAGEGGLVAYIANGVTTVRDLGSQLDRVHAWRTAVDGGSLTGPRILTAGPTIEAAWWLDPALSLLTKDPVLARFPIVEVSPVQRLAAAGDAASVVAAVAATGADLVKFRNLRGDEFRAVASEAARRGLALAGHAPAGIAIGEAAEAGLATFEHAETVTARLGTADVAGRRAQLARVAAAGAAITPTLVTDVAYRQTPDSVADAVITDVEGRREPRRRYVAPLLVARWQFGLDLKRYEKPADWADGYRRQVADIRLAHAVGVPLLVGTDLGVSLIYPGFSVHDEMALLVRDAGLSPFEALQAATINPARAMKRQQDVGSVSAGQRADLVLLAANPLDDIANTTRIDAVVLNGRLYDRAALDSLLAAAATSGTASKRR